MCSGQLTKQVRKQGDSADEDADPQNSPCVRPNHVAGRTERVPLQVVPYDPTGTKTAIGDRKKATQTAHLIGGKAHRSPVVHERRSADRETRPKKPNNDGDGGERGSPQTSAETRERQRAHSMSLTVRRSPTPPIRVEYGLRRQPQALEQIRLVDRTGAIGRERA